MSPTRAGAVSGPARVAPRPAAGAARNGDGGAGVDRRRSRSTVEQRPTAENSDPPSPAAAPPGLSPKDTRLSEQISAFKQSFYVY